MRTEKPYKNNRGHAVRLKKSGDVKPEEVSWDSLFKSLDKFSPDFMDERKQPKMDKKQKTGRSKRRPRR